MENSLITCDAPTSRGSLIIHQPAEILWISCNLIPHHCVSLTGIHNLIKIGQSLLCTRSSIQNPTCTIIQSHDPFGAQYNTITTLYILVHAKNNYKSNYKSHMSDFFILMAPNENRSLAQIPTSEMFFSYRVSHA